MGSGNVKPAGKTKDQLGDPSTADTMPCHACNVQFTVFRHKYQCIDCVKMFCSNCINKRVKNNKICFVCEAVKRDMARPALMQLKIRDLQQYLTVRHVSTESCTEKTDLVDLILEYLIDKGLIPRPTPSPSSVIGLPDGEGVSAVINQGFTSSNASNHVRQEDALNKNIPESSTSFTANDGNRAKERTEQDDNEEYLEDSQKDFVEISSPSTAQTESDAAKTERLERRRQQEMREAQARIITEERPFPTEDPRPKKKRASLSDLNSIEEINELSVRALKEILAINFVDYRGCVEKQELVDRVKRLYNSKKKKIDGISKEDASEENDENLCKICMDATIDCVLLECGHMVTCTKCGKVLAECPICRVFITRVVHTFKS